VTEARRAAEQSLAGLGDLPRIESANARLLLGRVLREQGDLAGCIAQCTSAGAMLESMGATRQAAAVWRELGDIYREIGQADAAMDAYDRALRAVRIAPVQAHSLADATAHRQESDLAST
jgi:tetratricopeptide (TPR) repeat protein